MSGVYLEALEKTMRVIAETSPLPFTHHDPTIGQNLTLSPQAVASRSGYLPAIVNAGEAVWREATGKGFELDIVRDPEALLGYRLRSIGSGSFATVMLSSMEAMQQVASPEAVVIGELNAVWAASMGRLRHDAAVPVTPAKGPRP